MSYLISIAAGGSSVSKEFDPPLDFGLKIKIGEGLSLTEEEKMAMPKVLRVTQRSRGGVPAIIGWNIGPFIVCETLKNKLEKLEPGRHRFLPLEIWGMKRSRQNHCYGTYYWIISIPRLDAVVVDETNFSKGLGRVGFELSAGSISHSKDGVCVLNSDVTKGHHLWQLPKGFGSSADYPNQSRSGFFCSDELRDFIKSERMDGWDFVKKCVDKMG